MSSLIWNPFCLNLDADIVVIVRKANHFPMNWDSFLGYPLDDVEGFIKTMERIVYIRDIGKCTPMFRLKEICFAGLSVPEKNS